MGGVAGHAGRRVEGDGSGEEGHGRAAAGGGGGDLEAHRARRAVREEADRVERLARRPGRDQNGFARQWQDNTAWAVGKP